MSGAILVVDDQPESLVALRTVLEPLGREVVTAPSGEVWEWGPEDAAQSVRGPGYDFARLVTQRIHRDDTALEAIGDDAEKWLSIAQAFAGPAGSGRAPEGDAR